MTKAEKTRQMIIEKAAALFNSKGYAGTSMSDIQEATGLTKGGLYGNFKTKEEISLAAFDHSVSHVYNEIGKRTRIIDSALDKLKAVVYFYKERMFDPPIEGGCPILNTSIDADNSNPVLKGKVVAALNMWQARIVRTIEKGIESGEVKPETNADDFATLFIGTLEGGIMLARVKNDLSLFNIMAHQLIRLIDNLKA